MKLHYGWVVVSVGALATCVGMGAMFSLPVFLAPISAATGWSRAGIASAMTLNFVTMGVAAFGWGALSDRFGPRRVVLTGDPNGKDSWRHDSAGMLRLDCEYGSGEPAGSSVNRRKSVWAASLVRLFVRPGRGTQAAGPVRTLASGGVVRIVLPVDRRCAVNVSEMYRHAIAC